jgi:hypothetical protein
MTIYQVSWYKKLVLGPGRRAQVGTLRLATFGEVTKKGEGLLKDGFEVRILPLEGKV